MQIERYIGTLGHHLHEIGRNCIWELYLNLDRFSRNWADIILGSIQFVKPNFVQIERHIGTLGHHLHEIGRNYIWELYMNLDRFSRNLADIILGSIQYVIPNSVQIGRHIGTLGAPFRWNRTKLYMGPISKSGPIFTKLGRHNFRPKWLGCTKFRANRKKYRDRLH